MANKLSDGVRRSIIAHQQNHPNGNGLQTPKAVTTQYQNDPQTPAMVNGGHGETTEGSSTNGETEDHNGAQVRRKGTKKKSKRQKTAGNTTQEEKEN